MTPPHGTTSRYVQKCRCEACKQAQSDYMREYRRKNLEACNENVRLWKQANRERARELNRLSHRRIKAAVFESLGGVCCRCGFADERALQVDHVHGCAGQDRRAHGRSGLALYSAILRGDQSLDDFQLLCANCNWIKRDENGECGRG